MLLIALILCGRRWLVARRLVILYTNDTLGFFQPCLCGTGEKLGGLARRAALIETLRRRYPHLLLVDSGNGPEAGQSHLLARALARMGYDTLHVGELEWRYREVFFRAAAEQGLPLVGLSPTRLSPALPEPHPYLLRTLGSHRIALVGTGPLGPDGPTAAARQALHTALTEARAQADLVILLSQWGLDLDERLAREEAEASRIDLIIGGLEARFLLQPYPVRDTLIVPTSAQGRHLGFLEVRPGRRWRCRHRLWPLTPDLPEDEQIQAWLEARQQALRQAQPNPDAPPNNEGQPEHVPATQCGKCHREAYVAWRRQPHSQAVAALRTEDMLWPECLSCHSELYRRTGRVDAPANRSAGVECTACHGPGAEHVRKPQRGNILRSAEGCETCHTPEQSPGFDREAMLRRVAHWEEGNAPVPSTLGPPPPHHVTEYVGISRHRPYSDHRLPARKSPRATPRKKGNAAR